MNLLRDLVKYWFLLSSHHVTVVSLGLLLKGVTMGGGGVIA